LPTFSKVLKWPEFTGKPPKFLSQISEFLMLKAVFSHLKREAQ